MNALATSLSHDQPSHSSAFRSILSPETLRERVPAAFAAGAHERTSASYTFISTARVLEALSLAGFLPVEARQAARARSPVHARHLIRLRRRYETVQLRDAIPEIVFLNSHDGTSAYQLRVGLFRVACTNGLIVSAGVFPVWRVMHRGDSASCSVAPAPLGFRSRCVYFSARRVSHTCSHRVALGTTARVSLNASFPESENKVRSWLRCV